MTDAVGQADQGHKPSDLKPAPDHHGSDRRCSVPKDLGTPRQQQREQQQHGSLSGVEGFGDFEEFVLDFDDYDLLESIHTQLGSPEEPARKLNRRWFLLHRVVVQLLQVCHSPW